MTIRRSRRGTAVHRAGLPARAVPVVAALFVLALTATACTSDTTGDESDAGEDTDTGPTGDGDLAAAGGESITLALWASSPFFDELVAGAQEAADAAGVTLTVVYAEDDPTRQADQLADAAVNEVDAVVVNAVDSTAAAAAVQPVLDAGIPLVAVDRGIDDVEVTSFVASDNVDGGRQAAAALAEAIGFDGPVLHLEGQAGASSSRERGQGFDEGLADSPTVDVVGRQSANFVRDEGLDVATNLLQANPDVVGVFAENDEMALGAIEALGDRAGTDVQVVGFDGTADGLQAVQEGTMAATVAQLPRELGAVSIEQAVAAVRGEPVEEIVPVAVETVTADNVDEFLTASNDDAGGGAGGDAEQDDGEPVEPTS